MSWHFTHNTGVTISSYLKGQLCVCPFHINMAKHDLHSFNVFALQMTHFGNLHLDMADTVYQSASRVVVRDPHRTPLQWAERQESQVSNRGKRVFLPFNCFMCNIVK